MNAAERKADWWLFGGIYRPVWLEAKPQIRIEHIAVDAKMDGEMQLYTELKGVKGKEKLTAALHPLDGTDVCSEVRMWEVGHDGVFAHIWKNVEPWTPENLGFTISLLPCGMKKGRLYTGHLSASDSVPLTFVHATVFI